MDVNKNEEKNMMNMDGLQVEASSKEEAIRVCTRIRPLFEKEINSGHLKAWKMNETDMQLVVEPLSLTEMINARVQKKGNKVEFKKNVEKSEGQKAVIQRYYAFDRCFDENVGNEEVYKHLARDIVLDTFKGINGCILAYGQTGSGKTHSVMGVPTDPGMLPRSLAEFFNGIENPSSLNEDNSDSSNMDEESNNNTKEFLMSVTYLEVYMERVNDLLQEGYRGGATENLDVKEDPKRGFVVIGVQEETVTSIDEVMLLVAKAEQRRHISQTNFNETSSRSHTIFTVILESNQVLSDGTSINKRGELKIVDLAGNERAGRAAEGIENAKTLIEEGKAINKSLFVLSEVISKLSKRAQAIAAGDEKKIKKIQEDLVFIPWRDSKLTRILSKSLGGNCRASVIVAVHPSHFYLDTSFSTLRFALKCKTIKKKIQVNYLSAEQSVIMQQKELIAKLQNQLKNLATTKNVDNHIIGGEKNNVSARNPEDDEKILALKHELEEKVKKFQNFILKSELHVHPNNYRTLRSMDGNTEKSLKHSMTINNNIKNEYTWLRSFDTHEYDSKWDGMDKYEDQNDQENINISKAMDYLKNKPPYKLNSSEMSEDAMSNESLKDDLISLDYYNELEELERLEKNELSRRKRRDKGDVAPGNTSANRVYGELSKLSTMEYSNLVDEQDKGEIAKGKKAKKKKGKKTNNADTINREGGESGKGKEKVKSKGRGNKVGTSHLRKKKTVNDGKFKRGSFGKAAGVEKGGSEENGRSEGSELSEGSDVDDRVEENKQIRHDSNRRAKLEDKDVLERETKWEGGADLVRHTSSVSFAQPKEKDENEKRTSIISNLKEKIEEDLKKKKKIISRNVELNKQIKFIMKLMQKVGLSTILTGTVPPGRNIENVLQLQENLRDDLKLCDRKKFVELISGDKDNSTARGRHLNESTAEMVEEELLSGPFDDNEHEAEYNESISHVFINEMFFSFVLRIQQRDDPNGEGLKSVEEILKGEEKPFDVSKKALEDILGSAIANKVDEHEEGNPIKNIKDEKNSKTIDSILSMLTPWEQKILALLYEQQKMRQTVHKMKEKFSQRIQNINIFIKKILTDKVEVEKHFNRIIKATENYKNDLLKTADVDSNFKFAGMMKKLEELSISLAEKTRDFKVLAEFHLNLRKQMEKKDLLIKQLREENKLFYLVPKYNDLLQELSAQDEQTSEAGKELKKEFLLMYGRLMLSRKRLQEKEVIENDMRNLNKKIYTELVESIAIIKNLESQNRFLEFKLNMENKKKGEKVKKLMREKEMLNKIVGEMEKMLEDVNIDASEVKNEIMASYNNGNLSMGDVQSEEEGEQRERRKDSGTKRKKRKDKEKGKEKKMKKGTEHGSKKGGRIPCTVDANELASNETQNDAERDSKKKNMLREIAPQEMAPKGKDPSKKKQKKEATVKRAYSAEKIIKKYVSRVDTNLSFKRAAVKKGTSRDRGGLRGVSRLRESGKDNLLEKNIQLEINKKNVNKNKKKVGNDLADAGTFENLKYKNSIAKKMGKKKIQNSDLEDVKSLGDLNLSNSVQRKKKKKKKVVKGKRRNLLKYLNRGASIGGRENIETVLSDENEFQDYKNGGSTTDCEANEMRNILNQEIEKKKKISK
ncbi:kinesin-7, putative [Plasmodium knowlesi strain H]|uniref:Kinesin-7, putative n=3 Tax=Plasmodium knowlesi TaxID=5850 RepID=A0A5K1U2R7_PLAKH|nr:kinesin-like protein [Plasmodium knowlesi strain H]OTN66882.1 putative Kinesin-7 [Plasmodium knowlesi]CAA9990149.1 kinesin-7, putative [Plasmodium knowlesi strain H]SBO25839.1 kinesin-7, putative [Plasmodium knowlesi strain H]SBO28622.1 kinesin-7, putative [Plasmodium knowlesi strain H]VVS79623.1 kinesin-7, putative [Plasmodium knowlesi strain H]|eukprot:XP_002260616.1 kinesin-like protein [Plasmodium knowlesi strain H]